MKNRTVAPKINGRKGEQSDAMNALLSYYSRICNLSKTDKFVCLFQGIITQVRSNRFELETAKLPNHSILWSIFVLEMSPRNLFD